MTRIFSSFRVLKLIVISIGLSVILSGCLNYKPFEVRQAHTGILPKEYKELKELPTPQQQIIVGVYNFRDETGQYKISQGGGYSFSTAVTQGATSILLRALQKSGWFVPIERHDLSDLLNERKIISSIRAEYTGPNGKKLGSLPPLLYAGILLEGGIISYDSNVMTGGSGFRFFGIGSSGQYTQNQITIYLRAVSTKNGRILENVTTSKTILSKKLQGGAFLYVSTNHLLETETGYSYNEPTSVAVTAAITEAVKDLIIRGVKDKLWSLKNPSDSTSNTLFKDYANEQTINRDDFDRILHTNYRSNTSVTLGSGISRIESDRKYPQVRPTLNVQLKKDVSPWIGIGISGAYGHLVNYDSFDEQYISTQLVGQYFLFPFSKLTPYLELGGGAVYVPSNTVSGFTSHVHPVVMGSAGFEYMLNNHFGLNLSGTYNYSLDDKLDYRATGSYNDSIWGINLGLTYYLPFGKHHSSSKKP